MLTPDQPIRHGIVHPLLVLVFPAILAQEPAPPAPEVLSLDEALAQAMENNRPIRNAALEVSKAQDRLASIRTRRLPSLNLDVVQGRTVNDIRFEFPEGAFGTFPGTGPIPSENTDVISPAGNQTLVISRLTQPLTQLGPIGLRVQSSLLGLEIAQEQLRGARQTVTREVRRTYYALLRTQSALGATQESILFLKELQRVVRNFVAQQTALKVEEMEVSARVANEEYQALRLSNTAVSQQEELNDLLGRDLDRVFQVVAVPEVAPFETDLEAARRRALEQRSDLRQARLRERQAQLEHRIKRWDLFPDLSLMFSYISALDTEVLPRDFSSVGLLLSWDAVGWGRKGRALSETGKAVQQATNESKEAEARAEIEVGALFRRLQEARSLVDASRLARDAAREKLNVTNQRYSQKAALLKDVLRDQEALAEANRRYEQALLEAWTAKAELQEALGED